MPKRITLQGICFDEKSSYLKGTAEAPPRIREAYHSASSNYFAEDGTPIIPEVFDDKGDFELQDYGDIERISKKHIRTERPLLTLGGDHSITYPILRAVHSVYGPVDILHFDAHADLYDHFEGDRHSHACPFARIMEEQLASRLVQVGIRTQTDHQREQADKFNVELMAMNHLDIAQLPTFENPLYLSVDMDALDPAFAPGVSHHEPGGLTTRQLIHMIQNIKAPLVGADIVEYNPIRDINEMTAMVSAKLLKEIAALMVDRPQRPSR